MNANALPMLQPTESEFAQEWPLLPLDQQGAVREWVDALESLRSLECSVEAAMVRLGTQMNVSAKTARRMYDYARNGRVLKGRMLVGWKALVDWRKVPELDDSVPEATVTWWKQVYERYKGRANCGHRAHNEVIHVWKLRVHAIPGYEDVGGYPPSGPSGIPGGWGYSSFIRRMPEPHVRIVNQIGRAAGGDTRKQVFRTRVGLECGEVLMFDDVWHDFLVKPTPTAKASRMLELCCLDLFSAKRIQYGVKPELEDNEGVRQRIKGRDMRFLVAAVLTIHGYRRAGTMMIGEHGTAVLTEDVRKILFDSTGGAITFADGAIEDAPALLGSWKGKSKGNPRIKAHLESHFNLDHNALAMLPGQIGSNSRLNQPEELAGREAVDKALVAKLTNLQLPPELVQMIAWPWWPYWQATDLLDKVYAWVDGRHDHKLEGWERANLMTGEVRTDPRSPHWTPTYLLESEQPERRAALQALMQLEGCFNLRRMSPTEVWTRGSNNLVKWPMSQLPALLGIDLAVERKMDSRAYFTFKDSDLDPEALQYTGMAENAHGDKVALQFGETYQTFVNPFDTRWLLVCAANGRYIGRCPRVPRACPTDTLALHTAMGQSSAEEAVRLREYRARHEGDVAEVQEQLADNGLVLASVGVRQKPVDVRKELIRAGMTTQRAKDSEMRSDLARRADAIRGRDEQ